MSKSTKNIVLISIIIFVASAVSLGVMAYQVKEQGNQLSSHVATLQAESAQVESYNKLKKISEETTEDRDLLQSYFLEKESNSIDFLNLVESLAPQAGVQLDTEGLDVLETGENGAKWIEVSFVFSASRERVQNFIKVLETLPYVLRLTSVEMDGMSASEWEARVTMQVQILDYDK
ncbi:hypothetical protein H6781_02420 [Candidatus Nomurabacteria bacterium]|nr:hypothetical protein [Candidatus Kaiserbacteria bacterium]MCB9810425.1 hypothetical protein [Candidatus Nomurabacteria bacterium]MCB9817992.1 hypothetical protein [Candidatus Nomurabacteria bacterium]